MRPRDGGRVSRAQPAPDRDATQVVGPRFDRTGVMPCRSPGDANDLNGDRPCRMTSSTGNAYFARAQARQLF